MGAGAVLEPRVTGQVFKSSDHDQRLRPLSTPCLPLVSEYRDGRRIGIDAIYILCKHRRLRVMACPPGAEEQELLCVQAKRGEVEAQLERRRLELRRCERQLHTGGDKPGATSPRQSTRQGGGDGRGGGDGWGGAPWRGSRL